MNNKCHGEALKGLVNWAKVTENESEKLTLKACVSLILGSSYCFCPVCSRIALDYYNIAINHPIKELILKNNGGEK